MDISLVIPVYNDWPAIRQTLDALEPERDQLEVIVADGGSRDGSQTIHEDLPWVKQVSAPPGRGPQQNAGAAAASGELLVFLTQDVEPATDDFLEQLIAPLTDPKVAGSTSRVLPHPERRRRELRRGEREAGQEEDAARRSPPHGELGPEETCHGTRANGCIAGRSPDGRSMEWRTSRAAYGGCDRGHRHSRGSAHQKVAPVQETSHSPKRTRRGARSRAGGS